MNTEDLGIIQLPCSGIVSSKSCLTLSNVWSRAEADAHSMVDGCKPPQRLLAMQDLSLYNVPMHAQSVSRPAFRFPTSISYYIIPYHCLKNPSLLLHPHIQHLERRICQLDHVTRFQGLGVDISHGMRVEDARLCAVQNCLFAWRIREAEAAPATRPSLAQLLALEEMEKGEDGERSRLYACVPRLLARRANYRYALWHHHLIPHVRVQVPAAHKACLARMRMYPPQHHQFLFVAVVE
jgi:hypothetical protein